MSLRLRIVQYWLDRTILDLPKFEYLSGSCVSIDADIFPWNEVKSEYRPSVCKVSLGILPFQEFSNALLSVIAPDLKESLITKNDSQYLYLASFDIDGAGIPIPASAVIHPSLMGI